MPGAYPEPWYQIIDERQGSLLEEELKKEIGYGHALVGLVVRAVAKRDDRDDSLVSLENGRVAEVRLTWTGKSEPQPHWPRTVIFKSLQEW